MIGTSLRVTFFATGKVMSGSIVCRKSFGPDRIGFKR
jgi:hypothetical protein